MKKESKIAQTQEVLLDLFKHDLEACEAYKDALTQIESGELYQKILSFLRNHERHVDELSKELEELKYLKIGSILDNNIKDRA